jgi:small subunit ribosomal protein S1
MIEEQLGSPVSTTSESMPAKSPAAADSKGQPEPDQATTEPTDSASGQPAGARGIKIGSQRPAEAVPQLKTPAARPVKAPQPRPVMKSPVPNIRQQLSPELELEVAAAFGDLSLEDALQTSTGVGNEIEPDSRRTGRIAAIHEGEVFVDLGGRNQGVLSLLQFAEPPAIGQNLEFIVRGVDAEDGLYRVSLPGGTIEVGDWSEIRAGELVEARITGHNKGGLECEVNRLRGFIPASQISTYRVEDLAQFVGEKMVCLITDANPEKRNLVLSRRAVLEREKADAREKLLTELAEGQVREGTVRSLQDFGAFVDLGGVDGLLHVSQLGWHRVKHPCGRSIRSPKRSACRSAISRRTPGRTLRPVTRRPASSVAKSRK